jgi:hypothetical protein
VFASRPGISPRVVEGLAQVAGDCWAGLRQRHLGDFGDAEFQGREQGESTCRLADIGFHLVCRDVDDAVGMVMQSRAERGQGFSVEYGGRLSSCSVAVPGAVVTHRARPHYPDRFPTATHEGPNPVIPRDLRFPGPTSDARSPKRERARPPAGHHPETRPVRAW